MKVNELMSPEVKCCSKDTSLDVVAMCCALNHKVPWELSASTVTGNQNIHTCSDMDDMETALSIMEKNKVRRLPAINSE